MREGKYEIDQLSVKLVRSRMVRSVENVIGSRRRANHRGSWLAARGQRTATRMGSQTGG